METIDVYWFKRDLRLVDNQALSEAMSSGRRVLLVYIYEPNIWNDPHYDTRHLNFIKESISDINKALKDYDTTILAVVTDVIDFVDCLERVYTINTIFSTQETGLDVTFQRDIIFSKYCQTRGITWKQFQANGVIRGLKNRSTWRKSWYSYMGSSIPNANLKADALLSVGELDQLSDNFEFLTLETGEHNFQLGGPTRANLWMDSFFEERIIHYSEFISKPENSRYGCSRLSPYLAWGNLSIRMVYQRAFQLKKTATSKKQLSAFISRLRWQSHFIQKFEMEPRMEFEAVNEGFLSLEQPIKNSFVQRWKDGMTGYPLVDASMRCVKETGYINFRMRSMVTSFLTHHLFQHFSTGGPWLARQFLDFEPGIHYGQMQMQAGLTGTNTVRVYNPVKNAIDHDSEAIFIKKYVPELRELPIPLAIKPWTITPLEEEMYQFNYGTDYPKKLVEISETRKVALEKLYGQRKSDLAQAEKARIVERHVIKRKSK
ncbi:MAG: FAD-binding domain-containing protein [Pricia sp.]